MTVSNVLSEEKKTQIIALGQLGWSLRRIEKATGVRRETAAGYLKASDVPIRPPGPWGKRPASKPANEVTADSGSVCTPYLLDVLAGMSRRTRSELPQLTPARWLAARA